MKVLLDEIWRTACARTSARMRFSLSDIKVGRASRTANFCGQPNRTASRFFSPGIKTLVHEQNLKESKLGIIALSSVEWDILKDYLPLILTAIDNALPGSFQEVDCGNFKPREA